jgi:type II secretory ATPase GspE/PulE/Tfp pilus assembly ATPase PilB-like protein
VLSTLHTNDALGAVPRLCDMKVEPFLLGSTLNTIIAQRLARRTCEFCLKEQEFPPDVKNDISRLLETIPADVVKQYLDNFDKNKIVYFKGQGCSKCGGTGYNGRVAIVEVLNINDKIRQLIINKNASISLDDIRKYQKFTSIEEDGILKVLKGLTTYEEILRVTQD